MKFLQGLLIAATIFLGSVAAFAYVQPLGGSIFPLSFIQQPPLSLTDAYNQLLALINAQTVGISATYPGAVSIPSSGIDTSAAVFSTTVQGNPLVQETMQNVAIANVNAKQNLLVGQTGRTLYPAAPITAMAVGGTAGGGTNVSVACTGGALIESWPLTALLSGIPSAVGSTIVFGSAYSFGCPQGQGIMVSSVGTVTTATGIVINLPYTVQ